MKKEESKVVHVELVGWLLSGWVAGGFQTAPARSGRTDPVRSQLETLVAGAPESADAAAALARLHADQGAFDQVVRCLKPHAHREENYQVQRLLGQAYLHLQHWSCARRHLEHAAQADPRCPWVRQALGTCFLESGKIALATTALREAFDRGLDTFELHFQLARCLHHQNQLLGPTRRFELFNTQAGEFHRGWFVIEPIEGERSTFLACGPGGALFHVQKALKHDPDSWRARILLGDIYLKSGRPRQALEVYSHVKTDAIASPETLAEFHARFAQACRASEDVEGYLNHLEQAARADAPRHKPDLHDAYLWAARHHAAQGRREPYILYLEKALNEKPDDARTLYDLGAAYYEMNRWEQAARAWKAVLKSSPHHPDRARMFETILKASSSDSDVLKDIEG